MGAIKWEGGAALVHATSASEAPVSPYRYPDVAGECSINGVPITYGRLAGAKRSKDKIVPAGKSWAWKMQNIQPNTNIFGWIGWNAFGSDTYNAGPTDHTIACADDLPWLNVLCDELLDKGSSVPTKRLVGAKIGDWEFEQRQNAVATLAIGGRGCDEGAAAGSLTVSIPTGLSDGPLGWDSLKAGEFKIGYNLAAVAQDNDITGFKLTSKRNLVETGRGTLGSNQPTDLRPGKQEMFLEITKEFFGASAKAMYDAWKSQQLVQVSFKYLVNAAYKVESTVMTGHIVDDFSAPIGGDEGLLIGTLKLELFEYVGAAIAGFTVKDSTTALYT